MAKKRDRAWTGLQRLEPRELMTVNVVTPLPGVTAVANQASTVLNLKPNFDDPDVLGKVVRFDTVLGTFFTELFDVANGPRTAAPLSTAQFLNHVNGNLLPGSTTTRFSNYNGTIVHRVDTSVGVIQGGAFEFPGFAQRPAGPTVVNEYSDTRPNTRGTIALAKVGGNPDSATNQWFINTKDNTTVLGPTNNGGFTTFGQVLGSGMTVVDAIAALPVFSGAPANASMGNQVPLRNTPPTAYGANNVVLVNSVGETSEVVLTATSSDSDLVRTSINAAGDLVLDFGVGMTGTATITVRATDHTGQFTESTFEVMVAPATNAPTVGALLASDDEVSRGSTITLAAQSVADAAPGTISRVEFYRDSNGNGVLEPGVDTLLGRDTSATGGYTLTTATAGLATGDTRYFARAVDNDNQASAPVTVVVDITNTAPTLTRTSTVASGQINSTITITYLDIAGGSNEADRNGDAILFRIEGVLAGTLTKGGQAVVPGVTTIGTGESLVWTPPASQVGIFRAFTIRAFDGELASRSALSIRTVVNRTAIVTRLYTQPLVQPGAPLTLSAKARDPDGEVRRVEFYRDSNNNGTLETATDQRLGEDANSISGWKLTTPGATTNTFPTGQVRVFARAFDNTNVAGNVTSMMLQVNAPPSLGDFTASTGVTRPGPITLTLADVVDTGGEVRSVEFFLDVDGNGAIGDVDRKLGNAQQQPGTNTFTLTTSTQDIPAGMTRFIARATDNKRATTTKAVVATIAPAANNTPPAIATLTATPTLVNRGQTVQLQANGVTDLGGAVQVVEFYIDDGDGMFEPDMDIRFARDFDAAGGYTASRTISSTETTGLRKFYARAVDIDGVFSEVKEVEITINPLPTIGQLMAVSSIAKPAPLTLTAVNVADTLGGSVVAVEFFRDTNNNTILDGNDAMVGIGVIDPANMANWVTTVDTASLPTGNLRFFVRARDNNGALSNSLAANVTVT